MIKILIYSIIMVACTAQATTPSPTPSPVTGWTKIEKDPATGVYINYWHDAYFSMDFIKQVATLVVNGYPNLAAYSAHSTPMTTRVYNIPLGFNPTLGAAGKTFLSTYARSQSEFTGSQPDTTP